MSEKNKVQILNENELSAVNGGYHFPQEDFDAAYPIGQMVRFGYIHSEKNDNVYYEWVGKVLEIVPEYPEGFFYKLELDEQARQIANTSYLLIWYECVLGLA